MDKPEFTGTVTSDYHTRLRDEFAMRAMSVIMEKTDIMQTEAELADCIARASYVMADAMIKARQDK